MNYNYYSEPPRKIGLAIKITNLFGGFANQFGWTFIGFGMIFVWVFTAQFDVASWFYFKGKLVETNGIVNSIETTNMSVNDKKVFRYNYTFEDEDGNTIKGSSYSNKSFIKRNERVIIEYPKGKAEYSRIKGTDNNIVGLFGLFPLIFPIIGLFFVFFGLRKGIKANKLLKIGYFAEGLLENKTPTNSRVNGRTVYKFIFSFKDRYGKKFNTTTKTHKTYDLTDDIKEKLLYNPNNPQESIMFDNQNINLKIADDGSIKIVSYFNTIKFLFIPFLTIIGHTIIFFYIFL